MHSPVTQDIVVSQEEITPTDSRGWGRKQFQGGGKKQKQRALVETSLTTREDGETAVAEGNALYLFLPGIYTGRSSPG